MERQAWELAQRYQIVVWFEEGEYYGRGFEMPGAMGDGKTPDECVENTRRGIFAAVATMLENGEPPPPAWDGTHPDGGAPHSRLRRNRSQHDGQPRPCRGRDV